MLILVLAAGKGERMQNMTADKPKTMICFQNRPLLTYQVDLFNKIGIDYRVVGGYLQEKLAVPVEKTIVNKEYSVTNMVYSLYVGLKKLRRIHAGKDIVVTYGDIIFERPVLDSLINADNGSDVYICADRNYQQYWKFRMGDDLSDLESFEVGPTGYVTDIGRAITSYAQAEAQYIGLIKISSRFVERLQYLCEETFANQRKGKKISMTDFFLRLIQKKDIKLVPVYINSGWLEFDSVADIDTYHEALKRDKLKQFFDESNC